MENYFVELTEKEISAWIIIGMCLLVLGIGIVRKKAEILLNVGVRAVTGTLSIYFINGFLAASGISASVGINLITVLTSAILGFPGVAALYGICFCSLL